MNNTPINYAAVSNIVIEHDNVPMTTSLKVAEVFDKEHFHVLTAIRNLDCSPEFKSTNFSELNREYRGRLFPYYLMTRDGFTFLAMGFTGAKAAEFKEK